MVETVLEWGSVLLAAVVLGSALYVSALSKHGLRAGSAWASPENVFLLVSDFIVGALLLLVALLPDARLSVCFALGTLAITHLFRCAQKIIDMPRPYCATTSTTLFNVSKAVTAAALWGVCFALMSV